MSISDVLTKHADAFRNKLEMTDKFSLGDMTGLLDHFNPIVNPNLLKGTKDFNKDDFNWAMSVATDQKDPLGNAVLLRDGLWQGPYQVIHFDEGWYTFSCYLKADKNVQEGGIGIYANFNGAGDQGLIDSPISYDINLVADYFSVEPDTWIRKYVTFNVVKAGNGNPRVELAKNGGNIYFSSFKLEKGKMMTPWCPNVADKVEG